MNSNKLLIITVIFAVLILGTAIIYALMIGKQGSPAENAPALQSRAMGEQLVIPDSLTRCNTGDTCVVVDTTCSFCCKYVAINAAHEQLFDQMFNDSCTGFKGTMCECFDLSSYPKCVDGVCTMVKFAEQPPR